MTQYIRTLNEKDYSHIANMQTGINDDYVLRVFPELLERGDTIYGLFADDQLACIGGFSVIAGSYAMLGRLRSDTRFRGYGYATTLMKYITTEAFKNPRINWVGANTEENNLPARRVLEKIGLTPIISLYGATTKEPGLLKGKCDIWTKIDDTNRKQAWLESVFTQPKTVFPYECYYPLPATPHLFEPDTIKDWVFYENAAQTRMVILKPDRKKHQYLHVVYPWSDFSIQEGLWETIESEYKTLKHKTSERETLVWIDLTEYDVSLLPWAHPFTLKSPWILHGITRDSQKYLTELTEASTHAEQTSSY
ncbi:hypothetical protein JNUCC1_00191 [Lentibacillus sp. JNUCC-1]|uniref:GNAT family N-acetyltransferase n=1 Tax=Lentibacillus sp. JNUCC-1 TaxID=2654513 RepID=UPI0012E89AA4|nr:GNAT family N-acetyltransferase [Lentibacillus sp. JNUCC-1]MUV36389.1 hypothetical protein [Lentibacillus sp. JNUCC-1]